MKNISYIINGILLVAIIVLYVLFFSSRSHQGSSTASGGSGQSLSGTNSGIVYINMDSVLSKYEMNIDVQKELQDKLNDSEKQLKDKQADYQKAVEDFQYKAGKHLITQADGEVVQQKLAQQEQELYGLQNDLRTKLNEEEQVAQRKVLDAIMKYLDGLEVTKNHQFVLGTTFGGNVLYANKNLNISNDIIVGLNKAYELSKAK
jgi:outer membrane protein